MMQVHAQDLHTNSRPVEATKMKDEQFARLVRPAARRVTFQVVPFVLKGSLKSLVEKTIEQGRFTHRNTSPFLPTAPPAARARLGISDAASGGCDFTSLAQLHQLERVSKKMKKKKKRRQSSISCPTTATKCADLWHCATSMVSAKNRLAPKRQPPRELEANIYI